MATYTTSWKPVTPQIGLQAITEVSTTQQHPLGTIIRAKDTGDNANGEGEFVYVKGVANGAEGSWVLYAQDDGATSLLAADAIGPVGVLMAALVAATYGWAQISGKAVAKALVGFVDNANVYATATAGSVDDAVVAGDRVKNAKGASAVDAPAVGMAEFEIQRPFMDDGLAA